jgi:hypothetical protein
VEIVMRAAASHYDENRRRPLKELTTSVDHPQVATVALAADFHHRLSWPKSELIHRLCR